MTCVRPNATGLWEWMCLPVERGQKAGRYFRFQPESRHLHFVCWKPSVKPWSRPICIAGWPWRGWFCSLLAKSRARTLLAPKPAHPTTNRHPPAALHPPPHWHYFLAKMDGGYSTIVFFGQEYLLGALSSTLSGVFQCSPRAPNKHTHTSTHT